MHDWHAFGVVLDIAGWRAHIHVFFSHWSLSLGWALP
jgi:hypothetical protein